MIRENPYDPSGWSRLAGWVPAPKAEPVSPTMEERALWHERGRALADEDLAAGASHETRADAAALAARVTQKYPELRRLHPDCLYEFTRGHFSGAPR